MCVETATGPNKPLYGTTAVTHWLPVNAKCCQYHTFIFHSKDPELVLFGHLDTCTAIRDGQSLGCEDFLPIFPEESFSGLYQVTETMSDHGVVHRTPKWADDGKHTIWYVHYKHIKPFLADVAVVRYEKKHGKENLQSAEKTSSSEDLGMTDINNANNESQLRTRNTLNADGDNVSGSGDRPRRLTRGQYELGPQGHDFSVTKDERTPLAQSAQHRSSLSRSTSAEIRQPTVFCPYHGNDRCEVDDPHWVDRRGYLFDHDHHPADSCTTSTNRDSHVSELHVRHHYRAYRGLSRATNYRRAQVEVHQENAEQEADNENETYSLRGGARFDGACDSERSPAQSVAEETGNDSVLDKSGYSSIDEARNASRLIDSTIGHGPHDAASQLVMAEASGWYQASQPSFSNVSALLFKEKCGCYLRMVSDIGEPIQEAPLIWKTYCREHNSNADGRQPCDLYVATHGTAPPPYQETKVAAPEDPRPSKIGPTLALRGGALDGAADDGMVSDDDWVTTSEESERETVSKNFPSPATLQTLEQKEQTPKAKAPKGSEQAHRTRASSVRQYAERVAATAQELDSMSLGSDNPISFTDLQSPKTPKSTTAPTAPATQNSTTKTGMGLRGGGRACQSGGQRRKTEPSRRPRRRNRRVLFHPPFQLSRQQQKNIAQRIKDLDNETGWAAEHIEQLEAERANLLHEVKGLEGFIGSLETEQNDLYQQLDHLTRDKDEREDEVNTLRMQNNWLIQELGEQQANNTAARRQLDNLHRERTVFMHQVAYQQQCWALAHLHQGPHHPSSIAQVSNVRIGPPLPADYHNGHRLCQIRPVCSCDLSWMHTEATAPVKVRAMALSAAAPSSAPEAGAQSSMSLRGGGGPSYKHYEDGYSSPTQLMSKRQQRHDRAPKTVQKQSAEFSETPIQKWWDGQKPECERQAAKKVKEDEEKELKNQDAPQTWKTT